MPKTAERLYNSKKLNLLFIKQTLTVLRKGIKSGMLTGKIFG